MAKTPYNLQAHTLGEAPRDFSNTFTVDFYATTMPVCLCWRKISSHIFTSHRNAQTQMHNAHIYPTLRCACKFALSAPVISAHAFSHQIWRSHNNHMRLIPMSPHDLSAVESIFATINNNWITKYNTGVYRGPSPTARRPVAIIT